MSKWVRWSKNDRSVRKYAIRNSRERCIDFIGEAQSQVYKTCALILSYKIYISLLNKDLRHPKSLF